MTNGARIVVLLGSAFVAVSLMFVARQLAKDKERRERIRINSFYYIVNSKLIYSKLSEPLTSQEFLSMKTEIKKRSWTEFELKYIDKLLQDAISIDNDGYAVKPPNDYYGEAILTREPRQSIFTVEPVTYKKGAEILKLNGSGTIVSQDH